jgi:hypothetical protein
MLTVQEVVSIQMALGKRVQVEECKPQFPLPLDKF